MINIFKMAFPLCLFITILSLSPLQAGEGWTTDFESARQQAKKDKKGLLLLFTGTDWCPACKRLHANILSKQEFVKQISQLYILVLLDYPRNGSELPPQLRKQNMALFKYYKIRGFPTVVLTNSNGVLHKTQVGYGGERLVDYMEKLIGIQAQHKTRRSFFPRFR